jgi:hypothetical protein
VSQFFSNYFVNEARKSSHSFRSPEEEFEHIVENYPVYLISTRNQSNVFEAYLFKKEQEM